MLNSVNVIEIPDSFMMGVAQLLAFTDDEEGNKQAEDTFKRLVRENQKDITDEELEDALDDGHWDDGNNYWVGIVHSTPPEKKELE